MASWRRATGDPTVGTGFLGGSAGSLAGAPVRDCPFPAHAVQMGAKVSRILLPGFRAMLHVLPRPGPSVTFPAARPHAQPNALRGEDFREMYEENFLGILGKDRRWGSCCVRTTVSVGLP